MLTVETAVGRQLVARARERGWGLDEVAGHLRVSRNSVEELLRGAVPVAPQLAADLAGALGESMGYWLDLDAERRRAAWLLELDAFSVETLRELRQRGHVTATKRQREVLAQELADFFECDPSEAAASTAASFRQSGAHPVRKDAVGVWLRLAKRQAARAAELRGVGRLDRPALQEVLPGLLRLSQRRPQDYLVEVVERLADVGVVLVFQADVPGTRLSGASWPAEVGGYGAVALTLRHAKDDFFWWTLFHECAHLLMEHGVVVDVAVDDGQDREAAADAMARDLLLPGSWSAGLGKPSRTAVSRVAESLQVAAGVLVGQLQHSGRVRPQDLNGLKLTMPAARSLELDSVLSRPVGAGWDALVAGLVRASSAR